MTTYNLTEISGLFGLTNQQLREQLSAIRPLLEMNGRAASDREIESLDEYGLQLLCHLNKLMEDAEPAIKEVGRAAHLVLGRE